MQRRPSAGENALQATAEAWKEDVEVEAEVLGCRDRRRGLDKVAPADSAAQGAQRVTVAQGPDRDSVAPAAGWLIAPEVESNVQAIPEADFSDQVAMVRAQD